jgi:hypothetical protein
VKWNFVKDLDDRNLQYSEEVKLLGEPQLRKLVCSVLETSWKQLCVAKGREARQKRRMALCCYRQELKYDYERLSGIFGGIHPTNISRAIGERSENTSPLWERLQYEIQNAKRKI